MQSTPTVWLAWVFLLSNTVLAGDWPMLGHDAARSGATADAVQPPFTRKWYRLFADEGLMTGVQPIVVRGKVILGTLAGRVYAIDAESGRDAWVHWAGGPVLHACAAYADRAFVASADGTLTALAIDDGAVLWCTSVDRSLWNAPAVHDGRVYVGTRGGALCAVSAADGKLLFRVPTGGPILSSPAVDAVRGRVYAGSEDMHVIAVDAASGELVWRSEKLPGVSFRGYHPVIAPDGAVMITAMPSMGGDAIQEMLLDMVKEVFGDFASWRHGKEENDRLRAANFRLMEDLATYRHQLDYLRRRLTDEPACQTFFVLDPETGRQRFVAPIVYGESMNGPMAPPLVASDGRVIVKYQALLRSRYEHYSPFLNVGYLDTKTGHITPVMDQSRTYGWHDSLLLVHDEQCQLALAGRTLINTHQDNVNAMDLDTLAGMGQPWAVNIHEPQPGEPLAIWERLWSGGTLPTGKEWLIRGTAVYGGGSVLDIPVVVAGDSFYYLPTHEMSAGAALVAYRMGAAAAANEPPPLGKPALTDAQWPKIQELPWDWDTLATPRLEQVLKALPGPVPGTRQSPLNEEAARRVAAIPDEALDRFVWETPHRLGLRPDLLPSSPLQADISTPSTTAVSNTGRVGDPTYEEEGRVGDPTYVVSELSRMVNELVESDFRPLVFPPAKHPIEAYRFFVDPADTVHSLALAFPHLDKETQRRVRDYVGRLEQPGGRLGDPVAKARFPSDAGEVRSLYDPAPEDRCRVKDDFVRTPLARLYTFWLWADRTGDWSYLERHWRRLQVLADEEPSPMEEDCRNGQLAGLIAYCRIAARLDDREAVDRGIVAARRAMHERLQYELAYTRGGVMSQVPVGRTVFSRWRNLTPEVGRLCAEYAGEIERELMRVYVDHHRPTWWLAWNAELAWRNESPLALPTMSAEIFAARALILNHSGDDLAKYLDIPWCRGDLFYLDKLALCLEAP